MSYVILINSCKGDQDRGINAAVRDSWVREWRPEYKFVVGRGAREEPDTLLVDESDEYQHMPDKHRAGFRWAVSRGYNYVFQACTDTYVCVPRLLSVLPLGADYVGHKLEHDHYASGGAGFWVSSRALKKIVDAPLGGTGFGDQWAGNALAAAGFTLTHDNRYCPFRCYDWSDGNITTHLSTHTGGYSAATIKEAHGSWLKYKT